MIDRRVRPRSYGGASALLAVLFVAGILAGPAARSAAAQLSGRGAPSAAYYAVFGPFYDGDYPDALRAFEAEGRSSIKTAQSRWIDSICYETMCGECYFQMGVFDAALPHFTAALQLYMTILRLDDEGAVSAHDSAGRRGHEKGGPLGR